MSPLLALSRMCNGILLTGNDIVTAHLVSAHFFVYLNSQTLVLSIIPGNVCFLPLVATYRCVSTYLLRNDELKDQMRRKTYRPGWGRTTLPGAPVWPGRLLLRVAPSTYRSLSVYVVCALHPTSPNTDSDRGASPSAPRASRQASGRGCRCVSTLLAVLF